MFAKPPLKIKSKNSEIRKFLSSLQIGLSDQELQEAICNKQISICFQHLQSRHLIVSQKVTDNLNPVYSRTLSYLQAKMPNSHWAWQQIQSAKIAILGCGGIGSLVAEHLVAMGVQNLSLIDGDVVEQSNLNRQLLFTQNDCGKPKVDCLRHHLLERIPHASISSHKLWIKKGEDLEDRLEKDITFLVVCYDHPPIFCQIWSLETAINREIPYICGSLGINWGSWGPLLARRNKKVQYYQYLKTLKDEYKSDSSNIIRGSICATNHMIAAWMSMDIFNFLCNDSSVHSFEKKVCLNFNTLEFKFMDFCNVQKTVNNLPATS